MKNWIAKKREEGRKKAALSRAGTLNPTEIAERIKNENNVEGNHNNIDDKRLSCMSNNSSIGFNSSMISNSEG